jgi:uncharacterized protein (DUF4415 family)
MGKLYELFQQGKPLKEKDENIVLFELDLSNPPPLTAEQVETLDALNRMPDSEIDLSDIPEMSFKHPRKRVFTVCVDCDVFGWIRSQGKDYHKTINTILRQEMISSLNK